MTDAELRQSEHQERYCDSCGQDHHINPCKRERPKRKVICQDSKGHKGSHHAMIFWEDEQ